MAPLAQLHPATYGIGDNSGAAEISIEVRAFNSLARFIVDRHHRCQVVLPAGSTIADVLSHVGIPEREVFLVLRNGRDITPELNAGIRRDFQPETGDVIAFSGPIPYSWGYGAPVV
jgi:hypothetical protein